MCLFVRLGPRCSHLYSLDAQPVTNVKNSKKTSKKLPKQVQCSECSLVWCFRCSAPWHENFTCKQFVKGDKLLMKWINEKNEEQWNARKCPKCSMVIQRNGGRKIIDWKEKLGIFLFCRLSTYDLFSMFM